MAKRDIERESGRLESWKEIAAYFDRDLRTVIRWEKDLGLPVRRYPGKAKGRVYAEISELKAWAHGPTAEATVAPVAAQVEHQEPAVGHPARPSLKLSYVVVGAVAAVLVAALGPTVFLRASQRPPKIASVAVLPFENLGGESDPAFVEGLTDDISASLSGTGGMRVAGRRSAYQFTKRDDLRHVRDALHVDAVVEGSVQRVADKTRISVQLDRTSDGFTVWAHTFDLNDGDLLRVGADIAADLGKELGQRPVPTSPTTNNERARALYLQGRYLWNQRNLDAEQKSVEYMRKAIVEDPVYAQAWSGLAESLMTIGNIEAVTQAPYIAEAKQATQRALQLDPNLAEAHAVLGRINAHYDYDWAGAQREYQSAFQSNPSYATAHQYYALGLMAHGEFGEAEKQLEIAQQLDPLALIVGVDMALLRKYQRDYKGVVTESEKVLQLDPNYKLGYSMLVVGYSLQRDRQHWRDLETKTHPDKFLVAYAESDMARAKHEFENDERLYALGERQAFMLATEALAVGQRDTALAWLQRAVDQHEYWALFINVDPQLDALHNEPRFQALVEALGVSRSGV